MEDIQMAKSIPDVFSTHSAARVCRVTPMTIIRWIEEGRIKAYKTPGGHRRVMRADLEEFCRECGIPMAWEVKEEEVKRVLIIDDDASVVDAILDALVDGAQSGAFKVEHTNHLFEAGRKVTTFTPHFIFVNVELLGLHMAQFVASIRGNASSAQTRLVALSSSITPKGFDDLLRHPIGRVAVHAITGPIEGLESLRRS